MHKKLQCLVLCTVLSVSTILTPVFATSSVQEPTDITEPIEVEQTEEEPETPVEEEPQEETQEEQTVEEPETPVEEEEPQEESQEEEIEEEPETPVEEKEPQEEQTVEESQEETQEEQEEKVLVKSLNFKADTITKDLTIIDASGAVIDSFEEKITITDINSLTIYFKDETKSTFNYSGNNDSVFSFLFENGIDVDNISKLEFDVKLELSWGSFNPAIISISADNIDDINTSEKEDVLEFLITQDMVDKFEITIDEMTADFEPIIIIPEDKQEEETSEDSTTYPSRGMYLDDIRNAKGERQRINIDHVDIRLEGATVTIVHKDSNGNITSSITDEATVTKATKVTIVTTSGTYEYGPPTIRPDGHENEFHFSFGRTIDIRTIKSISFTVDLETENHGVYEGVSLVIPGLEESNEMVTLSVCPNGSGLDYYINDETVSQDIEIIVPSLPALVPGTGDRNLTNCGLIVILSIFGTYIINKKKTNN